MYRIPNAYTKKYGCWRRTYWSAARHLAATTAGATIRARAALRRDHAGATMPCGRTPRSDIARRHPRTWSGRRCIHSTSSARSWRCARRPVRGGDRGGVLCLGRCRAPAPAARVGLAEAAGGLCRGRHVARSADGVHGHPLPISFGSIRMRGSGPSAAAPELPPLCLYPAEPQRQCPRLGAATGSATWISITQTTSYILQCANLLGEATTSAGFGVSPSTRPAFACSAIFRSPLHCSVTAQHQHHLPGGPRGSRHSQQHPVLPVGIESPCSALRTTGVDLAQADPYWVSLGLHIPLLLPARSRLDESQRNGEKA
jgi:hypothetical protein